MGGYFFLAELSKRCAAPYAEIMGGCIYLLVGIVPHDSSACGSWTGERMPCKSTRFSPGTCVRPTYFSYRVWKTFHGAGGWNEGEIKEERVGRV